MISDGTLPLDGTSGASGIFTELELTRGSQREKAKAVTCALISSKPEEVKAAFEKSGHFDVQGFKILLTGWYVAAR